ncbi:uncharacterized protein Z519_06214 [Cladophialophora bantiana CBS 173.52]|uniref:Dipeptidase n=1 Tax=Cladophialophora bantiana (strain ATCC 10958 / CBS 173.52 / CDC B-1940 / NIH 8579) TaxID=1442370 RepID=A0A0D2I9Z6_CLAB1|nr:uncharacterized protein Z519_06214 [Cladophialophora bantiana CBS 173.52]KIW93609.1 hypothetical protein Z519_06214 [Cladophialophora bantiana CBS 173.52]
MREGRLGGAFWTVWAPCYDVIDEDPGLDFNTPTNHLRDSLEMLDIIQNMIAWHPENLHKYPNLVAELLSRGWTPEEMRGVLGGNLKDRLPSSAIWEKRKDLHSTRWGGGVQVYWPKDVKEAAERIMIRHDEL